MSTQHRTFITIAGFALAAIHCGSTVGEPGTVDGGPTGDASHAVDSGGDVSHPQDDASRPHTDAGHPHGDGSMPCTPAAPTAHRSQAVACDTTRPPSMTSDASAPDSGLAGCTSDSQCTGGTNGRCMQIGQIAVGQCTYDACATDSECGGGKVCVCGTADGDQGRTANACIPSNCATDSDCGDGGFCSPTYDTSCGARNGVVGYFCHEPAQECTVDECTNDSDCQQLPVDGGPTPAGGYCAWDTTTSKWTCEYGFCSG